MSNSKQRSKGSIKTKPTIFPLGFTVGLVEDSLVIIDFVDVINGNTTIIESIALPKQKAEQLSQALQEATKNGKSED